MKMSKIILILSLALYAFVLFSCEKEELIIPGGDTNTEYFNLGSFSGIDISVPAKVRLTKSGQSDISIKTYQNVLNKLEVKVENNILEISLDNTNIRMDDEIEIHINMTDLHSIDLSGLVELQVGPFGSLDDLNVEMSGDVEVDFPALGTSVHSLDLGISGKGVFNGFLLESSSCTIDLSGKGKAELNVSESLSIRASGLSIVHYKGDPENVSIDATGNQEIIKVD